MQLSINCFATCHTKAPTPETNVNSALGTPHHGRNLQVSRGLVSNENAVDPQW